MILTSLTLPSGLIRTFEADEAERECEIEVIGGVEDKGSVAKGIAWSVTFVFAFSAEVTTDEG